jgi:four helix bundle protein
MNEKTRQLQDRTQRFYLRVIALVESLPPTAVTKQVIPQLLDSAGSTDSDYRAACRGRSNREFIAKLGVAEEEADESKGWLEALAKARIGDAETLKSLIAEADELVAIFTASGRTATRNAERRARLTRRSKR